MRSVRLLVGVLAVVTAITAAQAVPLAFTHQARMYDSGGAPLTGAHQVRFSIYSTASGGSAVWTEQATVNFDNGVMSHVLGSVTPLVGSTFDSDSLYLGVAVDSSPELSPRVPLTSAPYAIRADTATNVDGGVVDASEIRINGSTVIDGSGAIQAQIAFGDVTGVPSDILDGDSDTLAALSCGSGQVAKYNGSQWACADASAGAHLHNASDINAGTFSIDRIPVGSTSGTVAAGDHVHSFSQITGELPLSRTNGDLDISRTTGNIPAARLPTGLATIAGLTCDDGEVIVRNGSTWECGTGGGGGGSGVLLGSWEFDESNGTSFVDVSGNGSTLTAPTGGQSAGSGGHSGSAVAFSGGVLQAGANNGIPDAPYITVESWVRPTSTLAGVQTVLHKEGAYKLTQESGRPAFSITSQHTVGGVSTCKVTHGSSTTIGEWAHVSGYYNGREIGILLNGILQTSACALGPIKNTSGANFFVGAESTSRAQAYDGRIDETRLWGAAPLESYGFGATLGSKANPGRTCKDILNRNPYAGDGVYWIDPDGSGSITPLRALCDMRRDGGGWTLGLKMWYQAHGMFGVTGAMGSVEDGLDRRGTGYKLSDTVINAIIGSSQNFDVLADQRGHNSSYATANNEFVVLRNYTATWTYGSLMPESATTTTMQSYRAQDEALAWTGRLGCGSSSGGVHPSGKGINCYNVLSGSNPQGGAGCSINMGASSSGGWHNFYMSEHNSDTYLYICNGAQHSSSHDMNHRFWFRERN